MPTITLSPSGNTYECPPGTAILKAGLDSGMFMPYSCRSGVCKTCRGKVVKGEVDFGAVHPKYLPDSDKAQGLALLCCAMPLSDLTIEVKEIAAGDAIKSRYMPARILRTERAAPDVMVVTVGLPMAEPTMFRAGQYIEIITKDGTRRSYSISNMPTSDGVRQIELHIRHMPGGKFTDYVFDGMEVRDIFRVEMPLGSFFLRDGSDKPMVMLASGTGFSPIKSIVEYSLSRKMTRPITIYWGGRKQEDIYMMALAEKWATEYAHIKFVPVLSEATENSNWKGRTGFVHEAVMHDFPDMSGIEVYACGSPIVIESARRDFIGKCKLPEGDFLADSFLTAADKA